MLNKEVQKLTSLIEKLRQQNVKPRHPHSPLSFYGRRASHAKHGNWWAKKQRAGRRKRPREHELKSQSPSHRVRWTSTAGRLAHNDETAAPEGRDYAHVRRPTWPTETNPRFDTTDPLATFNSVPLYCPHAKRPKLEVGQKRVCVVWMEPPYGNGQGGETSEAQLTTPLKKS